MKLWNGIYYGSRLISSQYGTTFTHSEYDKIEKVYSIWICTYPPMYCRNTISEYRIKPENKKGSYIAKEKHFDLMRIIFICLVDPQKEASDGLIRLLSVLLSPKLEAEEKKKILLEEYHIKMTKRIEGEIAEMCNLSQGVWKEAWDEALNVGIQNSIILLLGLLGTVPNDLSERITSESQTDILNQWLIAARNSNSFDEFEKQICSH